MKVEGANNNGRNVLALIWSLPLVSLFFWIIFYKLEPTKVYHSYQLRTLLLSCCFAGLASFIYRKYLILGLALFLSFTPIVLFGFLPDSMIWIYWLAGGIFFLKEVWSVRTLFLGKYFFLILAAVVALIAVLTPFFSHQFALPFNSAKLAILGSVHFDVFYHAAVGAMLKVYGVVSHGLHGLGPLDYHFGSHALMVGAGAITGLNIIDTYGYFYVFVCIPLLGIASVGLAEELFPSQTTLQFLSKIVLYPVLLLNSGILSLDSFVSHFALWDSFLDSESYLVSLILLFSMLSVLYDRHAVINEKFKFSILCLIIAAMTITKVSTAFCGLGIFGIWVLLLKERLGIGPRWFRLIAVFAVCNLIFLWIFKFINPSMSDGRFEFLQFITAYVKFSGPFWLAVVLFFLIHFSFPIVAAIQYFCFAKIRELKQDLVSRSWLWSIVFTTAVGGLVVTLMYIEGGAGYYFSNIPMFLALPVLLCAAQFCLEACATENISRFYKQSSRLALIVMSSAALLGAWVYARPAILRGYQAFRADVAADPQSNALAPYIKGLITLRDDPASQKTIVYIPRTETNYWDTLYCRVASYFIPAVSQHAALYAWPKKECYEFLCGKRFHSNGLCLESQKVYTDEQLLSEAKRLGFERVAVVTASGVRYLY